MWGKIIEGKRAGDFGYRSQYAKIEEIILVNVTPDDSVRIASFYKNALVYNGTHPGEKDDLSEELEQMAKQFVNQWQESLRKRGSK